VTSDVGDNYASWMVPHSGETSYLRLGRSDSSTDGSDESSYKPDVIGSDEAGLMFYTTKDSNSWIKGSSYYQVDGTLRVETKDASGTGAGGKHYDVSATETGLFSKRISLIATSDSPSGNQSITASGTFGDGGIQLVAVGDLIETVGGDRKQTITGKSTTNVKSDTSTYFEGATSSVFLGAKFAFNLNADTTITIGATSAIKLGIIVGVNLGAVINVFVGMQLSLNLGPRFEISSSSTIVGVTDVKAKLTEIKASAIEAVSKVVSAGSTQAEAKQVTAEIEMTAISAATNGPKATVATVDLTI
jgi:hypothetical protein